MQWQGGVYERQIGVLKQSLYRMFHSAVLLDSAFRTAAAEIAAVINARPLTFVSEDQDDVLLVPNDFLHAHFSLPSEITPPTDATVIAAYGSYLEAV